MPGNPSLSADKTRCANRDVLHSDLQSTLASWARQIMPKEALDDSELRRAFDQFDEKDRPLDQQRESARVKLRDSNAMTFEVQVT